MFSTQVNAPLVMPPKQSRSLACPGIFSSPSFQDESFSAPPFKGAWVWPPATQSLLELRPLQD
uniref:Uncharacterized protein n=1 Tax=Tetraselmis sp. GSL018 TaxID=582737 RepID=A0A061QVJ5_9CHLO